MRTHFLGPVSVSTIGRFHCIYYIHDKIRTVVVAREKKQLVETTQPWIKARGRVGGRDGRRVGGREGGWEGGMEGGWEGGREGGREGWKEGGRVGGRDGRRVGGREGGWEGGREGNEIHRPNALSMNE